MKKSVLVLAVAVCAMSMICVSAMAAKGDKKEGAKKNAVTSVAGALASATNETGKVTGITITDKDGKVFNVVMEAFIQDVTALAGKQVHAKGEVKDADGKTMLTVKGDIKAVPEKKEGKGKGKGKKDAAGQ